MIHKEKEFETRKRVRQQIRDNYPPIEVGQFWICKNEVGEVMRRLLILAEYPTDIGRQKIQPWESKLWIFEEQPANLKTYVGDIRVCAEFNLRYVFELED